MRRNIKAGLAVGFLSFLHNNKAMMITGAIMLVVGVVVSAFLGSVLVHDYTSGNISPMDARPYPVYGNNISSLCSDSVHYFAMLGLGLLGWVVTGTG